MLLINLLGAAAITALGIAMARNPGGWYIWDFLFTRDRLGKRYDSVMRLTRVIDRSTGVLIAIVGLFAFIMFFGEIFWD